MKSTLLLGLLLVVACTSKVPGSNGDDDDDDQVDSGPGGRVDGGGGDDDDQPDAAPDGSVEPGVADLIELLSHCDNVLGGGYATDSGEASNIDVCGLNGAVFWRADLDVDCDGERTDICNEGTDSSYQNQTSARTSTGDWLDAAVLPYVVIPLPSERFNYEEHDLDLGTVIAVVYNGHLEFGVFGDQGPREIIGEASHKMASLLGIDPDPNTGGAESGAYYVAFTGEDARVGVIEDHDEAATLGAEKLAALLAANQ